MEATKEAKRTPKLNDKVKLKYGGRVALISFVHNNREVDLREYSGAKFTAKFMSVDDLIFTNEDGSFPVEDLPPTIEDLTEAGVVTLGLPEEEPTPIPEIELEAFDGFAIPTDDQGDFEACEEMYANPDPFFTEDYDGEEQVNTDTGEIQSPDASLMKLDDATRFLGEYRTIDDVKAIRDKAEAMRIYAKQAKLGLEAQNYAAEIKLRAERRAGELLAEVIPHEGGRPKEKPSTPTMVSPKLADFGISPDQSSKWQRIANIPEATFEAAIESKKSNGEELTSAGLLKKPHVAHNSGENEWYTPSDIIEAARVTMGRIALDPASSEIANQVVCADHFYTIDDNGLDQEWGGEIWLNPPYSQPEIVNFANKIYAEREHIRQACILVNNATETAWFQTLLQISSAVCLLKSRVKFLDTDLNPTGSPLQGQVVFYIGGYHQAFAEAFEQLGSVLYAE